MNGEDWGYREWGVKQVRTGKQESRDGGWGGGVPVWGVPWRSS